MQLSWHSAHLECTRPSTQCPKQHKTGAGELVPSASNGWLLAGLTVWVSALNLTQRKERTVYDMLFSELQVCKINKYKKNKKWVWWQTLAVPTLGKWNQEDQMPMVILEYVYSEFKASLGREALFHRPITKVSKQASKPTYQSKYR